VVRQDLGIKGIEDLANRMHRFDLLPHADITALVDDRFARQVDLSGITDVASILAR
jgi:hypothetical protein